jgi:hypothetical protein
MSSAEESAPAPKTPAGSEPGMESFLDGTEVDLGRWAWLWEADRELPTRSHRRVLGGLVVFLKRLLRPLVRAPQSDLWERQRLFNLILIGHLRQLEEQSARLREHFERLGSELQQVQSELVGDLRAVQSDHVRDAAALSTRIQEIEELIRESRRDILQHHDALFARLDQKLDRLRRSGPTS